MTTSEALEAREGVQLRVSMPHGDAGRGHVETTEARGGATGAAPGVSISATATANTTPRQSLTGPKGQGPLWDRTGARVDGTWVVGGLPVGALDS